MTDIVMISVDDLFNVQRFRDAFGVEIHTPNFDRLADMGVSFSNAYASTALCNPSRTSILTGQNPFKTGVHANAEVWHDRVDPAATLPAILKAAGYDTYGFGKTFHSTLPAHISGQLFDQYAERGAVTGPDKNAAWDAQTVANVAAALAGAGPDPMFIMAGLWDPHAPFLAEQQFFDLYPRNQIVVPEWDGSPLSAYVRSFLLEAPGDPVDVIQSYLANISEMDFRLGQLLDAIETSGRNPAIVLHSDHGYSMGDHDHYAKFTLWEQAANAPLLIYHPDMAAGGTVNAGITSLLDLAPTILDMAGIAIPATMDGRSLLPSILDPSLAESGVAITTMGGSVSIRTGDYRYTLYEDGSTELFRISTDPDNAHNLSGQPAFADVESDLSNALDQALAGMGVSWQPGIVIAEAPGGNTEYFVSDAAALAGVTDTGGFDSIYLSCGGLVTLPFWSDFCVVLNKSSTHIVGGQFSNTLIGYIGNDTIIGAGGHDNVSGYGGNDTLGGSNGNDTLNGSYGLDTLVGHAGNDSIIGQYDADTLTGGSGNDTLWGGDGDDRITGSEGDDRLMGNAGSDRFMFFAGEIGEDRIIDYDSGDTIRFSGMMSRDVTLSYSGGHTIIRHDWGKVTVVDETLTMADLSFG